MEGTGIKELSEAVLVALRRLGYATQTIDLYRRLYARLLRYAEKLGVEEHSVGFCERWLTESFGIDPTRVTSKNEEQDRRRNYLPIRVCQCLTEWRLHRCLALKKQGKLAALPVPEQFRSGYDSYVSFCRDAGYSERGTYTRLNRIKRMLLFFDQHGVADVNRIKAADISAFYRSQIELDSRTVATMLTSSRVFFRHLFRTGLTEDDLSQELPTVKPNRPFKLPRVWRQEDVLAVLSSIDRGNPVGKRDYAILMLISRYGLRSADVKTLRLSELKWDERVIEIVQNKTGTPLRLPILRDVGWVSIPVKPATHSGRNLPPERGCAPRR
jgi:integrase/recombinase XerD